jgi:hypothetical protein
VNFFFFFFFKEVLNFVVNLFFFCHKLEVDPDCSPKLVCFGGLINSHLVD